MRVSQKVDYALRAMIDLAQHSGERRLVRSADVAARAGIPERYLESIMVELARAGLIRSRRGPEGGHQLARPAESVTVAAIHDAVTGSLNFVGELRVPERRVRDGVDACLRGFWQELERDVRTMMEGVTLAELEKRAERRREALDFGI